MNTTGQHFGEQIKTHLPSSMEWELKFSPMQQQQNGYDCGVYLLAEIKEQVTLAQSIQGTPSRRKIYEHLHDIHNHTSYCEINMIAQPDTKRNQEKNTTIKSEPRQPQKTMTRDKEDGKQIKTSNRNQQLENRKSKQQKPTIETGIYDTKNKRNVQKSYSKTQVHGTEEESQGYAGYSHGQDS